RQSAAGVVEAKVGNGTTVLTATGTTVAVAGRAYHLALVYTLATRTLQLFVNGDLDAQLVSGGAFTPAVAANSFRIGAAHNPSGGAVEYAAGTVFSAESLAVGSRLLSKLQVQQLVTTPLVEVLGQPVARQGEYPPLDPTLGANTVRLEAVASAAPLVRLAWRYRARFD